MVINELKTAFNQFADLNFKAGFSALHGAGSDILGIFLLGYAFSSLRGLLRNKNLKTRQKILPLTGHALYFLVRGGLAIAILVGAGALIPVFLSASSFVGTYRNLMAYYKERKERANLKMELMSQEAMLNKLAKVSNPQQRKILTDYVTKPDLIYEKLYDVRKKVITDPNLDPVTKMSLVTSLNDAIVNFSQNKNIPVNLTEKTNEHSQAIFDEIGQINNEIASYQVACEQYKQMSLRTSFKENIAYYKSTHHKIFAQDLPLGTKKELMNILNGGKLTEAKLNQFYAMLGNHYLNTTPTTQLRFSDTQFSSMLQAERPQQAPLIQNFIQAPRAVYTDSTRLITALQQENIPVENLQKSLVLFTNEPASQNFNFHLLQQLEQLEQARPTQISNHASILISEAKSKIQANLQLIEEFNQIPLASAEQSRIKTFQKSSLNQFASLLQQPTEFPSPAIKFNLHEGDLLIAAGITPAIDAVSNKFSEGVKILKHQQNKAKKKLVKHVLGEQEYENILHHEAFKDIKSHQHGTLAEDFEKRYESSFSLIFKKERLNFVEYSIPRRLFNAGLTAAAGAISLLATAAIISPLAPSTSVLTSIGMIFTGTVMTHSIYLYQKQEQGTGKIRKVIKNTKGAVGPDFETSKEKQQREQKLQAELALNAGQAAKTKPSLTQQIWQSLPFVTKKTPTATKATSSTPSAGPSKESPTSQAAAQSTSVESKIQQPELASKRDTPQQYISPQLLTELQKKVAARETIDTESHSSTTAPLPESKGPKSITVFQGLTLLAQNYLQTKENLERLKQISTVEAKTTQDQQFIENILAELDLKDNGYPESEKIIQAQKILANKLHLEQDKFSAINQLYLVGVRSQQDEEKLNQLLADPLLAGYAIDKSKKAINDDPTRRYFESHLCNETLKYSLDKLDKNRLHKHFDKVFHKIPLKVRMVIPATIYHGSVHGIAAKKSDTAPEYISAIKTLRDKKSFASLDPSKSESTDKLPKAKSGKQKFKDRKEKMMLLAKTAHAAMTAVSLDNERFPLNLYQQDTVYQAKRRGRVDRKDEAGNKQNVMSNALGIMRSYMPLPQSDELYSSKGAQYVRPTDKSTFTEGAEMPEAIFGTQVTPFVNSISGTMLCQLRIIAQLVKKDQFEYAKDPEQFKEFLRSFVSYMLVNSGGHSIHEFLEVLKLPEIKEEFAGLFPEVDIYLLFQQENEKAFADAMKKTVQYNASILKRSNVLDEVKSHPGSKGLKPTSPSEMHQRSELPNWVKEEFVKKSQQKDAHKNLVNKSGSLLKSTNILMKSAQKNLTKRAEIIFSKVKNTNITKKTSSSPAKKKDGPKKKL